MVPGQGTEIPHALGQLSQLGPQPRPNKTETKQKGKAGKCVEETFLQKNTQRASRHMQKRPDSLILRETQVKTTARHHCTPVRMAVIKKKNHLVHFGTSALLVQPCGKQDGGASNRNRTTMEPSNPTSEYLSKRIEVVISKRYLLCLLQHYSQHPGIGNRINVHKWTNE